MDLSKSYAEATNRVAKKYSRPSINLWKDMQQVEKWESFFYDGLHFSKAGNDFVAKAIVKEIAASYPNLAVTPCSITQQYANSASSCPDLEQSGPYHDQIDHLNHKEAFTAKENSNKKQKTDEM
mmetsp:Transcript_28424/g.42017  ORF Transcript_28424/g.42017 Transcript_28424/m.42017 type:complete len:124 (-) Transcript_28424:1259-1630(-)